MWIVRLALDRPYTFVVVAILILFLGVGAVLTTPMDIFPNIDIPVISVIWTYSGLPTDEVEKRITVYSEFVMAIVNDIRSIESQTLNGVAVLKIYFNPQVQPEATDKRTCWTKATRAALEALARAWQAELHFDLVSEFGHGRQLKAVLQQGDRVRLAVESAWGDRAEVERSFHRLLLLKAQQKLFLYVCARWNEAVIDQLTAAIMRYPHHIREEEYLVANLLGAENTVLAAKLIVPQDGRLSYEQAKLQPVAGSPFHLRKLAGSQRRDAFHLS